MTFFPYRRIMTESVATEKIKDMKSEIRQCYGALSSFQVQLHHLAGIIEESHSLIIEALQDIGDMDNELKIIKDVVNVDVQSPSGDHWSGKEQLKFSELTVDDQDELGEHAFDWCVEFKVDDKVIVILDRIGKAMERFKENKGDKE